MSNIFSKWTYRTGEGIEIAIPSGVSKPSLHSRSGRFKIAVSGLDTPSTTAEFYACSSTIDKALIAAVETLLEYYQSGKPIAKFHTTKKPGSNMDLPAGLCFIGVASRPTAAIQVNYPRTVSETMHNKYFSLGKSETYLERLEAVKKEAIEFREKQIELYRSESIRRMKDCLRKLRGGSTTITVRDYWFTIVVASHPDPSKLVKGALSFCLVPIKLPDGCRVMNGAPASLAIARAVGDNESIEWMAVDSEWKQALCDAILQSGNLVFNQWFQLVGYGSNAKSKQSLIDELRKGIVDDVSAFTEKIPLL